MTIFPTFFNRISELLLILETSNFSLDNDELDSLALQIYKN